MIITLDTNQTPKNVSDAAMNFIKAKEFDKAITLLENQINSGDSSLNDFIMLSKCYHETGDIRSTMSLIRQALDEKGEHPELWSELKVSKRQNRQLEEALDEIRLGVHASPNINYLKKNTKQMILSKRYLSALNQLREIAEARKVKTTTILWIGQYLKDIFFADEAENLKQDFDDLLIDEMLFYYLKSCKMYEKGFKEIQVFKKEYTH